MTLSAVIVNYNGGDLLDKCLESVFAQLTPFTKVIVVDNHSPDESAQRVMTKHSRAVFRFAERNLGFGAGANIGIREVVGSPYVVILNPDVVLSPDFTSQVQQFMRIHARVGLLGPRLLNPDGSIQDSRRRFYTVPALLARRSSLLRKLPWFRHAEAEHRMSGVDWQSDMDVDWVLGGCMVLRMDALADLGLFDERFFLYFEDVDLCARMWQHGWAVSYSPAPSAYHLHQRASAKRVWSKAGWRHLQSLGKFIMKYGGVLPRRNHTMLLRTSTPDENVE